MTAQTSFPPLVLPQSQTFLPRPSLESCDSQRVLIPSPKPLHILAAAPHKPRHDLSPIDKVVQPRPGGGTQCRKCLAFSFTLTLGASLVSYFRFLGSPDDVVPPVLQEDRSVQTAGAFQKTFPRHNNHHPHGWQRRQESKQARLKRLLALAWLLLSCFALPCLVLRCLVLFCFALSCFDFSCLAFKLVLFCFALSCCFGLFCPALSCFDFYCLALDLSCFALPCLVLTCLFLSWLV